MADITLKRGDLARPIVRRLRKLVVDAELGTSVPLPVSMTGVTLVKLLLKDQTSSATGGGTCTITNSATAEVTYVTQAADTATVRIWNAEFELTRTGGGVETVPSRDPNNQALYFTIEIVPDLG